MKLSDINISSILQDVLPYESFLFNPSIAHITGDTYLLSVRSYLHNPDQPFDTNPKLKDNIQHPWGTFWNGIDVTYILPITITETSIEPIVGNEWPIMLPVQDMRVFRFVKDAQNVAFILTFNERFEDQQDLIIKGGDSCDDPCYIINWSYLLVNINSLDYTYIPGQKPLCANISNPVEKNWSLWKYENYDDDSINLIISYALTPIHSAFSVVLEGIFDGELVGGTECRMVTPKPGKYTNIFDKLEKYYDNNLFVSLSTPSYAISKSKYQAVGHIKVKINYMQKLAQGNAKTPLAKFAQKYMNTGDKKHYNPNYVYFMFVYNFQVIDMDNLEIDIDNVDALIQLTGSSSRINAIVTKVSPAFVLKTEPDYDYFLNFPSGMVLNKNNTIISYGDGDASSHLLYISNDELEEMLIPITNLTAKSFKFLHGVVDSQGNVELD